MIISWKSIEVGVSQGSILGSLLFSMYLCDIFYFLEDEDITSYADDTTIYIVKKKEFVINKLNTSSLLLFKWFSKNFVKTNSDKSQLF